ncbi:MAG: hypothetical protein DI616_02055 [Paracoccus denitrificans]|uniref:GSCFA domain-containing protein n=1 Tax=Paracoccus denitrificans TaxID=266 RepID=A0A533IGX0_PARDE|nr:MAG: hypothetical protein DI616_02055 [Paracoccus denitrificans]
MALILHLGDAKCGSSAIQDSLHLSRDALFDAGILYETGPIKRNHFLTGTLIGQVTRSTDPDQTDDAHEMMVRIAERAKSADHVILSSERFLLTDPAVLFALFERYGLDTSDIRAIVYIREPRSMYASVIQQQLKASYKFSSPDGYRRRLDHRVKPWQEAIGAENLTVRRFDRKLLIGGDIVSDISAYLMDQTGVRQIELPPQKSNSSLSTEQLVVLQRLRRFLPEETEGKFHNDSQTIIAVFSMMNEAGLIGNPIRLNAATAQTVLRGNLDTITRMNQLVPGILPDPSGDLIDVPDMPKDLQDSTDVQSVLDKLDENLVKLFSDIVFSGPEITTSRQKLLDLFSNDPARRKSIQSGLALLDRKQLGIWETMAKTDNSLRSGIQRALRMFKSSEPAQNAAAPTETPAPVTTNGSMRPAGEVLKLNRENKYDRWRGNENGARERILQKVCVPFGRQSFTASKENSFFTMGSCFARNVEERLALAGANVLSRDIKMRDLGGTSGRYMGIFNKYNPYSILQELQFASGERTFTEASLLPGSDGLFYDSQLRTNSGDASKDELMARREEIREFFAQAFTADVLILTLGLIESWYDNETGLYLTEVPNGRLLARTKERFSFKTLSVADTVSILNEIHALLKRHSKPGQKVLITVSPVPIGRTFTTDDIIVANTTSKSTLRTAALEFISSVEGVDYFPSYEAAMHSHPDLAWQSDRLHVSDFLVGEIIRTFLTRYGFDVDQPAETSETAPEVSDNADLVARLNADVSRYKQQLITMEAKLKRALAGETEA